MPSETTAALALSGPSKRRLSRAAWEEIGGYLFILPWIIGFLAFTFGPMVYSLYLGFVDTDILTHTDWVGLENYTGLFVDPLWIKSMRNTAYYTFVMVPLSTIGSLLLAVLLNQKVRFLSLFRTIYYLPSVTSGVGVALLWQFVFHKQWGILNAILSFFGIENIGWLVDPDWVMVAFVIMSLWGVGGSMIIYLSGLQSIPTELYESASIDGAGRTRQFWHITLPMLSPTIFFNLVMQMINGFLAFTGEPLTLFRGRMKRLFRILLHLGDKR